MRRYGRVPDAGERSGSAAAALVGGYLLGRRGFLNPSPHRAAGVGERSVTAWAVSVWEESDDLGGPVEESWVQFVMTGLYGVCFVNVLAAVLRLLPSRHPKSHSGPVSHLPRARCTDFFTEQLEAPTWISNRRHSELVLFTSVCTWLYKKEINNRAHSSSGNLIIVNLKGHSGSERSCMLNRRCYQFPWQMLIWSDAGHGSWIACGRSQDLFCKRWIGDGQTVLKILYFRNIEKQQQIKGGICLDNADPNWWKWCVWLFRKKIMCVHIKEGRYSLWLSTSAERLNIISETQENGGPILH
jgi:hypothetical protein